MLKRAYIKEEMEETLKQMGAFKSSGPDGFGAESFKQHWSIVGEDVSKAVLAILSGTGMTSSLNSTFIALIPKVNNPTFVNEFRPISLCNVLYKLVSKVISNRLKHVMPFYYFSKSKCFHPRMTNYG